MPSTVTINANTYDVYVSVAAVDAWADGSLTSTDWQALVEDDKSRVLVMVTRWIDSQCWQGDKLDPAQPLQWPRTIGDIAIIEQSATVLALLVAANPELPDTMTGNLSTVQADGGTRVLKAGSVQIEYFRNLSFTIFGADTISTFPASVMNMIGQWLCDSSDGSPWANAGSTAFGTCAPARVGRRGKNNLHEPYG